MITQLKWVALFLLFALWLAHGPRNVEVVGDAALVRWHQEVR